MSQHWQGSVKWIYGQETIHSWDNPSMIKIQKLKDTLIENKSCGVYAERFYHIANGKLDSSQFVSTHILCYLNNQVTLYDTKSKEFKILYDFNLTKMDTLSSYCLEDKNYTQTVIDSIGFINISGSIRKIQFVRTTGSLSCRMDGINIEGIGNNRYLFPRPDFVDPPPGGFLRCFEGDGFTYSIDSSSCNILSNSIEVHSNPVTIYPNPSNGVFNLVGGPFYKITVYNPCGIELKSKIENNAIDLTNFQAGTYLIRFQNKNSIYIRKLVILLNNK
ncbi:MAG: T9SS type A sorting domain-containing protein [Saprospiraceae bacterium]|nr:T9SS type A sorting domain-containing protein [Saprospiraceae bacterium]